jgi:mRNA interferase MazF
MNNKLYRGDIYFANLGDAYGSEQGGRRPVIIVQNNIGNTFAPTVIVVPITSKAKTKLPTHLPLNNITGIRKGSVALMEQVRTIDKSRLNKRVGSLSTVGVRLMDAALLKSLDLNKKTKEAADLLTLCATCSRSFFDCGEYKARRADYNQQSKEPCTACSVRMGFDYLVSRV